MHASPNLTQPAFLPLRSRKSDGGTGVGSRLLSQAWVLLLFAVGAAVLMHQHSLLWQRVPGSAVARFVPDQVAAPLPQLPGTASLARACSQPLSPAATWRRAWARQELAACLADPALVVQGRAADEAEAHYQAQLQAQLSAAQTWVQAFEGQGAQLRRGLEADLTALRDRPDAVWTPLARALAAVGAQLGIEQATTEREAVGSPEAADRTAVMLRERMRLTQTRLQSLAAQPQAQRLQSLALMAAGLQITTDYGHAPPKLGLGTDRASLADALEWQRKAQGYAQRGFGLQQLHGVVAAILTSAAALLLVVAVAGRGRALPTALWALTGLLLATGALVLTDLALTGDSSLRYLAERQYVRFGLGDAAWPLILQLPLGQFGMLGLWWPLLAAAAGMALLGLLSNGQSGLLAPIRAWVRCSSSLRWGMLPMGTLLVVAAAAVWLLGMPAAVSELLVLLGVVGMATYLARQAPMANAGGGLQTYNLGVVAVAMVCAVGGSVWRGDLGHALVALMLAGTFAWMFGWTWLRWGVALLCALGLAALAVCLVAGDLVGPLAWLNEQLPSHAQDRMRALFDPFHASASDLARVRWLIDSAGASGWGLGYVPWQGLAPARSIDGLPLQGPSDYVLALVSALWGRFVGLALMAAVLLLFGAAAAVGLRTALRVAMPPAVRWVAAVGGFGCLVMAFKVVLSVGGVSGVLPLTGLPAALLGYGPVTHLAALVYLALALGSYHLRPKESARGVSLNANTAPVGAARRRTAGLALAGAGTLVALIWLGENRLSQVLGPQGQRHVAQSRLDMAQALTRALVPVNAAALPSTAVGQQTWPCRALQHAVDAWNVRLAQLNKPVRVGAAAAALSTTALQIDAPLLLAAMPVEGAAECRRFARTLGQMLESDLHRLVGEQALDGETTTTVAQGSGATKSAVARLSVFEKPRALGPRTLDYTTANAWWGLPGCLVPAHLAGEACVTDQVPKLALDDALITDAWLQRELAPLLHAAVRKPAGTTVINHRSVRTGPALGLTFEAPLQALAQRVADCYTGRLRGADCAEVLPTDAAWRERYFSAATPMRASALGLTLVEVASGRVVAMAGSLSDCSLAQLGRRAVPGGTSQQPTLALLPGQACAQLPDARSAWLGLQHPALWMLPPGSSLKGLTLVAGIDAGLVNLSSDDTWKRILAESEQRMPVQSLALAAGQDFLDVLAQVGYGQPKIDLLWGNADAGQSNPNSRPHRSAHGISWVTAAYAGTEGLRATTMTMEEAERIRREKEANEPVDQRYGHAVMSEFVAARKLADAALGGGDIRINTVGLATLWRGLDLQAQGITHAPTLHLLEAGAQTVRGQDLHWASRTAALRTLGLTSGVTARAWGGTAQGSCRVVFGACPAQGLPGVSGKTGTADFLLAEKSAFVKPGMQLPGKLFGGVFTATNGKRYAIAVTALRVREGDSNTLELTSSAPAEAALTVMRQMGLRAQN